MKPKYSLTNLRRTPLGASLATVITICLCPVANVFAVQWNGNTSMAWNTAGNWADNAAPTGNREVNTTSGNIATIAVDMTPIPVDIFVGNTATGILNHTAGLASTGSQNWMFVGQGTGRVGTYNLAGTGTGGAFTNKDVGSGTMTVGGTHPTNGDLRIGDGAGSVGTVNVNTSGSLIVRNDLLIGNVGTGTVNLDSGTVSAGAVADACWTAVGRSGGNGTLRMSGGTLTSHGTVWVPRDTNSVGNVTLTGGTLETKTFGDGLVIGEGTNTAGVVIQSGGTINTYDRDFVVSRTTGSTGTYTLSGALSINHSNRMLIGVAAGGTGNVNLNGGTLTTSIIDGGAGTANVSFNGTQIIATVDKADFINDLDVATIDAGGLRIDSNGKILGSAQVLTGKGDITKTGLGTLTLSGPQLYTSAVTVSAGKLVTTTDAADGSSFSVANSSTLGLSTAFDDDNPLEAVNVTLATTATGASLDFNLNNFPGNTNLSPLKVTGNLVVNGPITVNVTDALPATGTMRLLQYIPANRTGSGTFVLGTLPLGVAATLVDSGGIVSLNVTSVSSPRWDGSTDGNWDTTTFNWIDLVTGNPSKYTNSSPALFNDDAVGTTTVALNTTVTPASITFDNNFLNYTLTGTGKVSGAIGLLKSGVANLTLETGNNDYTGATTLNGGTTAVTVLADGGTASGIGKSSAAAANLTIGAATLSYTGVSTTINRGFTIGGIDSTFSTDNTLTTSGEVVTSSGNFVKAGAGKLVLSNPGALVIGAGTVNQVNKVALGTLSFDDAADTQTASLPGDLQVGTTGGISGLDVHHSSVSAGNTEIAKAANSTSTMVVSGTGSFNCGLFRVGNGADSIGNITVQDSGTLTKTGGWMAIGNSSNGSGTLTVKNFGQVIADGDFNVGDIDTSQGMVAISDSAIITLTNGIGFIGKNSGTQGTVNQSGGTFNGNSWISVGRFSGGIGQVNISGGTFNQLAGGMRLILGEEGSGTLNISLTGSVVTLGDSVVLANAATATGTLNLNGGTLTARQITGGAAGAGTSHFYFNGGLLKAGATANASFMTLLDIVEVKSGGAFIDSNGQTIAVALALTNGGGGGGLTKSATGTLQLTGANTYTGNTTVLDGTLSISSTYLADASTLTIGTVAASPAILELPNAGTDIVASLVIDGVAQPPGLYDSTNSGEAIIGVGKIQVGSASVYATWITGYFPAETNPAIIGPAADPDSDGQSNALEFALGGAPNSGSNNAKTYSIIADGSVDVGTTSELLMTIAVRSGTPVFAGIPSPTATHDGAIYTIQGSTTLGSFALPVTPVAVVAPASNPTPPSGFEYRTFSLDGSDGTSSNGFLRVDINY